MMRALALIVLLCGACIVRAQTDSYEIDGYAKYLFSSAKYPFAQERWDDHLLHARLNTRWYPSDDLKAVMELRFRGFYGESVENIPDFAGQIRSQREYMKLDAELWKGTKTYGYGEVDRLYLDGTIGKLELTLGRQRIAWGTSWVWNPTDIFNPQSVLDFDYEERPAADAIRVQYYTGAVSKVEAAFAPSKDNERMIAAGLVSVNMWKYDFSVMGGVKHQRWLFGAGWAGDIAGAGFRGEVLVREGRVVWLPFQIGYLGADDPMYSFVLSGDYTFPNSFYVHTEILHNSAGAADSAALFHFVSPSLGLLSPARWSVYQEFAYDLHPLVRGTVFGLYNPDDASFVLVPSLSWSVVTNLDLLVLGMFFHGNRLSEFGNNGSTAFVRLKYSF